MKEYIRSIQKVIDWLSFSEDKNDIGKLVVLSMFGICVLGSYGIEITSLVIHNLAVYEIAINKGIFKETFPLYYGSALIALFTKHLSTLLVVPFPLVLASFAGKVIIFPLIYKFANTFIIRKEYAYFLAIYFVLGGLGTYKSV
jgi:hypothetical protein